MKWRGRDRSSHCHKPHIYISCVRDLALVPEHRRTIERFQGGGVLTCGNPNTPMVGGNLIDVKGHERPSPIIENTLYSLVSNPKKVYRRGVPQNKVSLRNGDLQRDFNKGHGDTKYQHDFHTRFAKFSLSILLQGLCFELCRRFMWKDRSPWKV